jgi:hypothetical protein
MTNTLLKKFIDTGMDVDPTQSDGTERELMKKRALCDILLVLNGQVNISQKSLLFGVHGRRVHGRLRISMNQGQMKYCLQDIQKTKHG